MHRVTTICLSIVFAFPSFVLAQTEEVREEWVIPYALVAFLIGLGVYGICRPNRRSTKVKVVEE